MILLELEIEDYKQFRGRHTFTPGANGVVAIIGPNGAGKTTLFEAIEWCLFQPREIRNDELAPRSAPETRPRVRLRLASPGGTVWEVERALRKTSATAEVRKITDGGTEIVVNGSSAVTNYTATKLIGLEHKAFVATFFTRQKELSFFGSLKATDRRREVGRLLGLETIREAQKLIAIERTAKQTTANALQGQYEQESGERDFEAERKERAKRLVEIDGLIAAASVAVQAAEQRYTASLAKLNALVEKQDAARLVETDIARQESIVNQAEATITAARNALAGLDALEAERPDLAQRAGQLAKLDEQIATLEAVRERAQRRQSMREQQAQAQAEIDRLISGASLQLDEIPFPRFSPLSIPAIAATDPIAALNQVLEEAATIRSAETDALVIRLREIALDQKSVSDNQAILQRFIDAVSGFQRECDELTAGGHPADLERAEAERRDNSVKDIAAHRSSIAALQQSISDYEKLISRSEAEAFEPICTMCGRPIAEHDAKGIKLHAEERRSELEEQIARLHGEIARHENTCGEAESVIRTLRSRLERLNELSGRIANSANSIEAQRKLVEDVQHSLARRMAELERVEPVTQEEIAELQDRLTCERAVEALAASFVQVRASLRTLLDRSTSLTEQIAELGDVEFDPADLDQVKQHRAVAKTATDRLLFIADQSTRRPEHDRVIAEAQAKQVAASAQIGTLQGALAEHQIDDFALDDARDEMQLNLNEQKRQQHLRDTHRTERARIDFELKQLDKDRERLIETAKRAEEAGVLADDLDHMYAEFNDFERFVARRVKPQLEDMTSELVRVVTESKYESIVLDDDYGIRVFDGELGPYPLEHFSGGERDVVALAARLALSRLIGSQAANPPSFLVLDEVFGSLDRDRRTNLLDLLGSLAGSAESFQQLFVISHVDDVRVSAAFNEVWRVAELPDGGSRLESLNATGAAEDF